MPSRPAAPNNTRPTRYQSAALFAHQLLGVTPHPTQTQFLEDKHQIKVAACGRRWGKSTAAALDIIYLAMVGIDDRPTKQMVVAPTGDQYGIICNEVENLLLHSPLADRIQKILHRPYFEITLKWGSVILGRSSGDAASGGKNLRGHGVHRVVIDEAAFIPERVLQEAIIPMLADHDGQLVLISSPFGRNVFWEYFKRGGEGKGAPDDAGTSSYQFPSTLNPHISAAYIERQRETMTDLQFRAEWLAEFLDDQSTVFKWALIEQATQGALEEPTPGHRYVVGWDPAKYNDRSVVLTLDVTASPWHVVACESIEGRDYTQQVRRTASVADHYNGAFVLMDCTNNASLLEDLADALRSKPSNKRCDGLTFTNAAKHEIIDGVVLGMEHAALTFPAIPDLIREMRYYEYHLTAAGNVKLGAPDRVGAYDDHVTALALAVHAGNTHKPLALVSPPDLSRPSKYRLDTGAGAASAPHLSTNGAAPSLVGRSKWRM